MHFVNVLSARIYYVAIQRFILNLTFSFRLFTHFNFWLFFLESGSFLCNYSTPDSTHFRFSFHLYFSFFYSTLFILLFHFIFFFNDECLPCSPLLKQSTFFDNEKTKTKKKARNPLNGERVVGDTLPQHRVGFTGSANVITADNHCTLTEKDKRRQMTITKKTEPRKVIMNLSCYDGAKELDAGLCIFILLSCKEYKETRFKEKQPLIRSQLVLISKWGNPTLFCASIVSQTAFMLWDFD